MYPRIKELRKSKKLTQAQISEQLGMYKTTYVRYENGEREVPLELAVRLAQFFEVSLDYLAEKPEP